MGHHRPSLVPPLSSCIILPSLRSPHTSMTPVTTFMWHSASHLSEATRAWKICAAGLGGIGPQCCLLLRCSIRWRQPAHLLHFLLLIPKPPVLITQATFKAASCKPMWFPVLSQLWPRFCLSSSEMEHGRRQAAGARGSLTQDVSFIHLVPGHRKQRLQNK